MTCTAGCSGVNPHTFTMTAFDTTTGDFSGTGFYDPDPRYTWTLTGRSAGGYVMMRFVYTGLNPGYAGDCIGTTDALGVPLAGSGVSNMGQSFTWTFTRQP